MGTSNGRGVDALLPRQCQADFFVGVDLDYKDSNNLYRYPPKQAVQSALTRLGSGAVPCRER